MAFGKNAKSHVDAPALKSSKPEPRWAKWIFGIVMALGVAVGNVVYYAWTGDSLPSPTYGRLTRHGTQSNPGGAISLTVAMLVLALFFYLMHRRQVRLKREFKKKQS